MREPEVGLLPDHIDRGGRDSFPRKITVRYQRKEKQMLGRQEAASPVD